jgi:hypothetical protein
MGATGQVVADLDAVGSTKAVLRDDVH